ncbi:cell division protein SepF [Candidatus Micrarchaeota archaeon]|nr:cell division protein SepF [Candidatus Micrarchaeota archaeon]
MGIFDKILGKEKDTEEPDLGQYLEIEAEGDVVNPPADFYVKRVDLRNEGDANLVMKELTSKNIIIVNVLPLTKQPNRLKGIVSKLKVGAEKMNGDIALLTNELILLTPAKVKIVKSKQKPAAEKL